MRQGAGKHSAPCRWPSPHMSEWEKKIQFWLNESCDALQLIQGERKRVGKLNKKVSLPEWTNQQGYPGKENRPQGKIEVVY